MATQKINRLDPAWAMFAAAFIGGPWHPAMGCSPHDQYKPSEVADFADAMLRERDRRDREEREGPLDQEEWDEMQKARRGEA